MPRLYGSARNEYGYCLGFRALSNVALALYIRLKQAKDRQMALSGMLIKHRKKSAVVWRRKSMTILASVWH